MKRKNEELLIELAFGDLDPAEADRLRTELAGDPTQQATLRSYEELRASLGGLREVPEMQMSRERLRDAILAGGLRESRRSERWTWLGAPVAIAAVAFAFTMMVRQPSVPLPSGVAMTAGASEDSVLSMDPTMTRNQDTVAGLFGNEELRPMTFSEPVAEAPKIVAPVEKPIRVARSEPKQTRVESAPATVETGPATASFASAAAPPTPDAGMMTAGAVEESSEIIVLTSETNLDTGAQRATSMESSSNVVIGG